MRNWLKTFPTVLKKYQESVRISWEYCSKLAHNNTIKRITWPEGIVATITPLKICDSLWQFSIGVKTLNPDKRYRLVGKSFEAGVAVDFPSPRVSFPKFWSQHDFQMSFVSKVDESDPVHVLESLKFADEDDKIVTVHLPPIPLDPAWKFWARWEVKVNLHYSCHYLFCQAPLHTYQWKQLTPYWFLSILVLTFNNKKD